MYSTHKGAIVFRKNDSPVYRGFILPTAEAKPVIDRAANEMVMNIYTNTNLRKLKREIMKEGKKLSCEDGIPFMPLF